MDNILNQCDGCKRWLPIVHGMHMDYANKYEQIYMVCTKSKYKDKQYKHPVLSGTIKHTQHGWE
jgi:hypothetical protein